MLSILYDFASLFYPRFCDECGKTLVMREKCICLQCLADLAETNFHTYKDNPLELVFSGRVAIFRAAAFCFFRKESTIQNIVHKLKYKGNKEVGFYLGYVFGLRLKDNEDFKSVDVIVPIPLHRNRSKKRGYNQSEHISEGIAKAMSKQVDTTSLIRIVDTSTQTKKSRYHRWEMLRKFFGLQIRRYLQVNIFYL